MIWVAVAGAVLALLRACGSDEQHTGSPESSANGFDEQDPASIEPGSFERPVSILYGASVLWAVATDGATEPWQVASFRGSNWWLNPAGGFVGYWDRSQEEGGDEVYEWWVAPIEPGAAPVRVHWENDSDHRDTRYQFSSQFAWSPDGSRAAYRAVDESDPTLSRIHTCLPDGSGDLAIGVNTLTGRFPATRDTPNGYLRWSPDGSRIAYVSRDPSSGELFLHTIRPTGEEDRIVGIASSWTLLAWSPDGSMVAFADQSQRVPGLFVNAADGSSLRRVTDQPLHNQLDSFAWSPDGSRIAYLTAMREGSQGETILDLYTRRTDGRDERMINDPSEGVYWLYWSWNFDGSRIAFRAHEIPAVPEEPQHPPLVSPPPREIHLYTAKADGTQRVKINTEHPRGEHPHWSPTRDELVYSASDLYGYNAELWVSAGDGSDQRKLGATSAVFAVTPNYRFRLWTSSSHVQWSPDGSRIAFLEEHGATVLEAGDTHLVSSTRSGSERHQLTDEMTGTVGSEFRWSPDGEEIAYLAIHGEPSETWLLVSRGDGLERRWLARTTNWRFEWVPAPNADHQPGRSLTNVQH